MTLEMVTGFNWKGLLNLKLDVALSAIIESMVEHLILVDSKTDDCIDTDDLQC